VTALATAEAPILVSGANGFTGRFVCQELRRRSIPFIALLRPGRDACWLASQQIPVRFANLNNPIELAAALQGCRALLNVASIGFGAVPSILQACAVVGVNRAVFVSTTAIFTQLNAGSKAVRLAAEADIQASALDWTILRPTMIYGTPADRNMIRLIQWLNRWPFLPVFGKGRSVQQPVYVTDVAWAVVEVLDQSATHRRAFNLSGASPLTYNEVVQLAANALGREARLLHLPASLVIRILQFTERLGLKLPIKAEQIQRLNEDKAFDHQEASRVFGFTPISFSRGIEQEVGLYRTGADGLSVTSHLR
jgi:uncharacterized protein YbjT (DUF2867 family)